MKILQNEHLTTKYEENVEICDHSSLTLDGMVVGAVDINENCTGDIHGTVTADIHVRRCASANIYGTVGGTVYNHGGVVRIAGTVGKVITFDGDTVVEAGAIVRND